MNEILLLSSFIHVQKGYATILTFGRTSVWFCSDIGDYGRERTEILKLWWLPT